MSWIKRARALSINSYYILANVLLILFALVIMSHLLWTWRLSTQYRDFAATLTSQQRAAYPHRTDAEINELLNAIWENPGGTFEYERWVGFREVPRRSRFVNVNEFGFRENGGASRSAQGLNGSIWMFGGSTTFGYGVADSETIPALLEKRLGRNVYNFGRGYFYSAQENVLLRQLLKAGYRPHLTVFLDGINEACDIEVYQSSLKELFRKAQSSYSWKLSDSLVPVMMLADKISEKLGLRRPNEQSSYVTECENYRMKNRLDQVLRENLAERKSLCDQYKLRCMTFVQPFAGIHGKHDDFVSLSAEKRELQGKRFGLLRPVWETAGAVFVTDALDGYEDHAYVDSGHYRPEANKLIADSMAKRISGLRR